MKYWMDFSQYIINKRLIQFNVMRVLSFSTINPTVKRTIQMSIRIGIWDLGPWAEFFDNNVCVS